MKDRHIVVGTAGHVDHGKTALIKALTGVDTDRLPEEKARGISIDLGFARLVLPSGTTISFVDVPGHERFIKNMLAGATGVDLVLLVVAADEGVMPQTREHLAILSLLGLRRGLVTVTKADLADPEWLDLVVGEVCSLVAGTFLEGCPVIPASSVTGQGLDALRAALDELSATVPGRDAAGFVRLPVDRAFVVPGFGPVVTGTLFSGTVARDQSLVVLPGDHQVRVRGLEVHDRKVERARAGQRVAANLSGADLDQLHRGQVLAEPGRFAAARRLGVRVSLLPKAPRALAQAARVHLHLGTTEVIARVSLLDREELRPGDDALAILIAEEDVVAGRGDRFVIRSYSPVTTIGGGVVVEPSLDRGERRRVDLLKRLRAVESGAPEAVAAEALNRLGGPATAAEVAKAAGLPEAVAAEALKALIVSGRIRVLDERGDYYGDVGVLDRLKETAVTTVQDHHRRYPLRPGFPKEDLRSRLGLAPKPFAAFLADLGQRGMTSEHDLVAAAGWAVRPSPAEERAATVLEETFRGDLFNPPSVEEAVRTARTAVSGDWPVDEVFNHLVAPCLAKLGPDLYVHQSALAEARRRLADAFAGRPFTVAEVRDLLATSRRVAVPLLERLDEARFTRRSGDERTIIGRP
ncbi:MAG TPA: selenocysteine-specific translation elongation factor [Bacillota bacterium]